MREKGIDSFGGTKNVTKTENFEGEEKGVLRGGLEVEVVNCLRKIKDVHKSQKFSTLLSTCFNLQGNSNCAQHFCWWAHFLSVHQLF